MDRLTKNREVDNKRRRPKTEEVEKEKRGGGKHKERGKTGK